MCYHVIHKTKKYKKRVSLREIKAIKRERLGQTDLFRISNFHQ